MEEAKWTNIGLSIVAICVAIIISIAIVEFQKTNRCAFNNGFSRQYDSNVSGWFRK